MGDQWWADKEAMEKDKERPRWQLGDPCGGPDVSSDARFTGVVVAYEVREVELSDQLSKMGMENRRRFYFVQGEDGDNLLLHECELVVSGSISPSATGLAQSGRQGLTRSIPITASSARTSRA